jgi:hypothetical protein
MSDSGIAVMEWRGTDSVTVHGVDGDTREYHSPR